MTTATPTLGTDLGPVVAPAFLAMTNAAERFRQSSDAFRAAMSPTVHAVESASRDAAALAAASERLSRSLSPSVRALDSLVRWAGEVERSGRSAEVARLGRTARRIARGNTRISVALARILTHLRASGQTFSADLVTAALLGDPDALAYWQGVAGHDDGLGLVVLTMLEEIDGMRADADALAAEVATLVASVALTDLPETAEPLPPPRISLAGSLDLHAPPVAPRSATAGTVLTANGSPMR